MKARVFIASSGEGLPVAYAIQSNLDRDAEVTVWTQDVFKPGLFVLESLTEQLNNADAGIFVFTADDILKMRGAEHATVRDNVLFELGLWIGRLGRERSFIVYPQKTSLHLPSDLAGFNCLTFDDKRADRKLEAALGPACNSIRQHLRPNTKEDYGLKITSLKDGDEVPLTFRVAGTFTQHPPVGSVRAVVLNERSNEYWPKGDVVFDTSTGKWQVEINMGNLNTSPDNDTRLVIIASIGPYAKDIMDFQGKAGRRKTAWVGIDFNHTIKEDVQRLAQVRVKLL